METRLTEVRRILNTVVGNRMPNHSGKGKFWNLPRDQFVAAVVRGLPVVVPGDPAASGMIKAIRGTAPFDAPPLYRMPRNGPYVSDADIAFIEGWIRDGAPDVDSLARSPQIAELTAELATAQPGRDGVECLKRSLRAAIQIEFATIPPYLTAYWSTIVDPKHPNASTPVGDTILDIVIEEMGHMALACNMLVALGESPDLASPGFIPTYPGPLPGHVNPGLEIPLRRLTPSQLKVFMDIEYPDFDPLLESAIRAGRTYGTIGAFYAALGCAFDTVNPSHYGHQDIQRYDLRTGAFKIANLADVHKAIDQIRHQGEGSNTSPTAVDPNELAHFYRFREVFVGAKFVPDPITCVFGHTGSPIAMPPVLPMADIPRGGYQQADVPDPAVWKLIRQFDETFTRMLKQLTLAWTDANAPFGDFSPNDPIRTMGELRNVGLDLMVRPRPDNRGNFGPSFRLV